ncbi:MAG: carboxypeptidase-like regulatory domain-containing protein, partial [Gemmatimonadaceae bacterium]
MLNRMSRLLFISLFLLTTPIAAQQLHGVVRDSVSGHAIPGAVVMVVDSAGNTLSRNITGTLGIFRVFVAPQARSLRFLRIGFQPRSVAVAAAQLADGTFDIALLSTPLMLSGLRVTATPGCPTRPDRAEAFALLDQARAGLLAMVVAREANAPNVIRIGFDRIMHANDDGIASQTVRTEAVSKSSVSFNSDRSVNDLVRLGFRTNGAGPVTYFGPDADVLLSEDFARGYCFRVATADASRKSQVGLAFVPAKRRRGRVDIDGAVWIDTVTRTLHDIDFHYVGLDKISEGLRAGGRIHFEHMPSGIDFIDRWALRLVSSADRDTTSTANAAALHYVVHEIGGELASASWADGQTWNAPLGTVRIAAVNSSGQPAAGIAVGLENTDYRAITDSSGSATISVLVPGPYAAMVIAPELTSIGITLPTALRFVAERNTTLLTHLDVPTLDAYVESRCLSDGRTDGTAWIIGRVMLPDNKPAGAANVSISVAQSSGMHVVERTKAAEASGLFHYCGNRVARNDRIEVRASKDGQSNLATPARANATRITVMRIELSAFVATRSRTITRSAQQPLVISGLVTDSVTGNAVADARVSLLGTLSESVTDREGQFFMGGTAKGAYTVEVSTPELDSIGAVKRTLVVLGDTSVFLQLYLPSTAQITASVCGAASVDGVLIGRIVPPGDGGFPPNTRIVAEWLESHPAATSRSSGADSATTALQAPSTHVRWLTARADSRGTYRLCGLPTETPLVLRTEVDSGSIAAATPVSVNIAGERRFARADLVMTSGVNQNAVFMGFVVTDTTPVPVVDAEVQLTDLSRSVFTNALGGFRIND